MTHLSRRVEVQTDPQFALYGTLFDLAQGSQLVPNEVGILEHGVNLPNQGFLGWLLDQLCLGYDFRCFNKMLIHLSQVTHDILEEVCVFYVGFHGCDYPSLLNYTTPDEYN
jgi:hypothetical protein